MKFRKFNIVNSFQSHLILIISLENTLTCWCQQLLNFSKYCNSWPPLTVNYQVNTNNLSLLSCIMVEGQTSQTLIGLLPQGSSLIWVYNVCLGIYVLMFRIIMGHNWYKTLGMAAKWLPYCSTHFNLPDKLVHIYSLSQDVRRGALTFNAHTQFLQINASCLLYYFYEELKILVCKVSGIKNK